MKLEIDIPDQTLRDLLVCAFEGGSNYWLSSVELVWGEVTPHDLEEGGRYFNEEWSYYKRYMLPFIDGCSLICNAADPENDEQLKAFTLNREKMESGFQAMCLKYPFRLSNVLAENTDAEDGDVFLQFCLFGELIYG